MPADYRQVTFKVTPRLYELFTAFTRRLELQPYTMLRDLVESWAAAEDLMQRVEQGTTQQPEAFAELGRLVERIKTVMRLNGVFEEAVERIYAHYGVKAEFPARGGKDG